MNAWLDTLDRLISNAERCVLVTVAGVRGSAPREIGAKMIVTGDSSIGSIGGGQLEYQCIRTACEWLQPGFREGRRSRRRRIPLGANCGQCCGGVVEVLFEEITAAQSEWLRRLAKLRAAAVPAVVVTARQSRPVAAKWIVTADDCFASSESTQPDEALLAIARQSLQPSALARNAVVECADGVTLPILVEPLAVREFHVVVFGAGHVGSACTRVLATLGARVDLVDSRPGYPPADFADNVHLIACADPLRVVEAAPAGCYFLIMTHDHALDLEICARLLRRGRFSYCGLIGSQAKRRRFDKRFRALGLGVEQIDALTCPIGIDGISGKKPSEIAISVCAQLLRLRERSVTTGVAPNQLAVLTAPAVGTSMARDDGGGC